MPTVEGSHSPGSGGPPCAIASTTRSSATSINYRATLRAHRRRAHEGQFDFDPAQLDAAAAVDAFMQNHIGKADWDVAP